MNYWTTTRTTLALVSIGILLTPLLRRLGYLPPLDAVEAAADSAPAKAAASLPAVMSPELNLPGNGAGPASYSRH